MSNHPFSSQATPSVLARKLSETTRELVVVDVQPVLEPMHGRAYATHIADLIASSVRALIFYLSDDQYHDSSDHVLRYFRILSADFEAAEQSGRVQVLLIPKDRDWFSPWFDGPRFADIVPVARRMIEAGVKDSLDLGEADASGRGIRLPPPQVLAALRKFPNADLVGGSRGECLDEVELAAQVIGIPLHTLDEHVWVRS